MKTSMRQTLAIALLAGSTLSVVPAMAQTQQPYILRQGATQGAEGSGSMKPDAGQAAPQATPRQAQPSQDMGATTPQQGSPTDKSSTNAQNQSGDPRLKQQGDSASQQKPADAKGMQNAESSDTKKPRTDDRAQQKPEAQPGQTGKMDNSAASNSGSGSEAPRNKAAAGNNRPSNEVTGSISVSTEQRTQMREVLVQKKVTPAKVNVEINMGVAVPRTVVLHPLPPRIVEIVPAYRGYEYFVLADGRIIIVQPSTHEVVYILAG